MKELNLEQVAYILGQMKSLQAQHPKANVLYDTEQCRVNITYPLPKDYWEIKKIVLNEK